jgi:AcrR family transcriptional regulator
MSTKKEAPDQSSGVTVKTGYHHGDLRAQLINAVRDLVETHGPDGFSVSEAARRAGVSSAAPYKHFRDRQEILQGVAGEAMDRLGEGMRTAASAHPAGSLEAVAAMGQAYVDFAKSGPGVFRLVFGLTEGHEEAPELLQKGQDCFGILLQAVADCLRRPLEDPVVQSRGYMLWTCVHGHSFLTIDRKTDVLAEQIDDWDFLMTVSRAFLEPAVA